MSHDTVVLLFVIVAAAAIVLQAWLMFGVYRAISDIERQVEGIRADVKQRLDPLTQSLAEILTNSREPLRSITSDFADIARILRQRTAHVDAVAAEFVDRARLQVIRVDQMVSTLISKVESTTEAVSRQVLGPIQEAAAAIKGVRAGLEYLFLRRRGSEGAHTVQDEQLFI